MKKDTLLEIIIGTVGGLIFAVGMCMCLIKEWNLFKAGVVVSIVGFIILLCIILCLCMPQFIIFSVDQMSCRFLQRNHYLIEGMEMLELHIQFIRTLIIIKKIVKGICGGVDSVQMIFFI